MCVCVCGFWNDRKQVEVIVGLVVSVFVGELCVGKDCGMLSDCGAFHFSEIFFLFCVLFAIRTERERESTRWFLRLRVGK